MPVSIGGLAHAHGELATIAGLDLAIAPGRVTGIVGPSGCGKSTLLELVGGMLEPAGGEIRIGAARASAELLRRCAYMPQRDALLPWLSAIDNAALAHRNHGAGRAEARRRCAELFDEFGLGGFERALPHELSGGMRQRVAFLRTLAAGKPVLLLDEPFASLDAITRGEMQSWLATALRDDSHTVLLVTHDIEEALYLCDRVAILSPRPARVVCELEASSPRDPDRAAAVTAPEFVALRAQAMEALGGRAG